MTANRESPHKKVEDLLIADKNRHEHLEFMSRMFSHNLRSPVSGLKMLFRLLDMVKGDEREEVIQNIEDGSEVLFSMIDDLAVVFLDYRLLTEKPEIIDFNEVLKGVKSDLDELLTETDTTVEADFEVPEILYHREHLRILFSELISNSIKFCPGNRAPRIEIRSYRDNGRVMLYVADNACGIDLEKHRKDIFKMYKPLGKEEEGSKGIGLFRLKNIVEINGGKVELSSDPGSGTQFTIELGRE